MSVYVLNKISHLYDVAIFIQNLLGWTVIILFIASLITILISLDFKGKGEHKSAEKLKTVSVLSLIGASVILSILVFVYPENDTLRYWQSVYDIKGANG